MPSGLLETFPGTSPTLGNNVFLLFDVRIRMEDLIEYLRPRTQILRKNCPTTGSMSSLFSDLFKEIWRDILGGARDYSLDILEDF